MATVTNEKTADLVDLSGGVQRNTSEFLRVQNEFTNGINTSLVRIGAVSKSSGFSQLGSQISTTSTSTSTSSSTTSSTSSSSTTT